MDNAIIESALYFRLSKAAELIGCSADDLLHLGATANLEIMAPVLSEGEFRWRNPDSGDEDGDVTAENPQAVQEVIRRFGPEDRVVMTASDLSRIEGVGWTTPESYYCPLDVHLKIRELGKSALGTPDYDGEYDAELTLLGSMATELWIALEPPGPEAQKTTIDHLFVLKEELDRFTSGQPKGEEALKRKSKAVDTNADHVHGNTERFSKQREEILKFAIYCMTKFPDQCSKSNGAPNATAWARLIDEKAPLVWKDTGKPPLATESIVTLLRDAQKIAD